MKQPNLDVGKNNRTMGKNDVEILVEKIETLKKSKTISF